MLRTQLSNGFLLFPALVRVSDTVQWVAIGGDGEPVDEWSTDHFRPVDFDQPCALIEAQS